MSLSCKITLKVVSCVLSIVLVTKLSRYLFIMCHIAINQLTHMVSLSTITQTCICLLEGLKPLIGDTLLVPGTLFFAMSNVGEIYIHWICRNYIGYCTRSPHSY
ncbi:unnamed protein product, partial [Vitis vinifera]